MELCSPKFQCKNWVQSTAVKCKHQWWFKIGNKLVRTCLQCLQCLHLDISPCRPSFGGFELRDFTGKFWETFKMDTKRIHKSSNILEHPTLFNSCFDCYHHCDLWPDSNRMMRSNPCRVYMLNICCRQNAFWAEPKFGFHPEFILYNTSQGSNLLCSRIWSKISGKLMKVIIDTDFSWMWIIGTVNTFHWLSTRTC